MQDESKEKISAKKAEDLNKIKGAKETQEAKEKKETEVTQKEEQEDSCGFDKFGSITDLLKKNEKLPFDDYDIDIKPNEELKEFIANENKHVGESEVSENETQKPNKIKRRQFRNLLILSLGILLVFYFLYSMVLGRSGNQESKKALSSKETSEKIEFAHSFDQSDAKSVWKERIQNQIKDAITVNQTLTQQISDLNKFKQQITEQEDKNQKDYDQLKDQVNKLTNLNGKGEMGEGDAVGLPNDNTGGLLSESPGNQSLLSTAPQQEQQIRIDKLSVSSGRSSEASSEANNKTAKNYVPAGTFVKAIMLGGADVAAGAMSQSDPVPMLFRILGAGNLPNYRKSSLKNCIVTAAVIGDISSETGKIRLERMSCARPSGRVIDLPVEGTVFGPSGKNGVRGTPVWREKELLQRAFVAGTLSGISDGVSQKYTTTTISPSGAIQTLDKDAIFKHGASQGIGKAMDKLAEYNIRRAEQYHPVIQISAGTLVDIVFLKGFFLEDQFNQSFNLGANKNTVNDFSSDANSTSTEDNSNQTTEETAKETLRRMKSDA